MVSSGWLLCARIPTVLIARFRACRPQRAKPLISLTMRIRARPSETLRSRNAGNHELSLHRYRLVASAETGDSDEATTASFDWGERMRRRKRREPGPAAARDPAASTIRFGTTPVFLDDQDGFLARWSAYLSPAVGTPVQFVHRRSYRDIMGLLRSQEIEAAWICGFPWVVNKQDLRGLSIPLYEGAPLYRSYLIVPASDFSRQDACGPRRQGVRVFRSGLELRIPRSSHDDDASRNQPGTSFLADVLHLGAQERRSCRR